MIFHPSPLDVAAIGELIRKYRITFLVTTPTFLQLYSRRCTPEQFSSVRVILTGAEKLQARLAQAIEDKFGVGPIEGYGVTECAPVIAVNCPDFRAAGYYQPASRRGTVGQPLPGVSVQIVDPDSYTPSPVRHTRHVAGERAERDERLSGPRRPDRSSHARRLVHHRRHRERWMTTDF